IYKNVFLSSLLLCTLQFSSPCRPLFEDEQAPQDIHSLFQHKPQTPVGKLRHISSVPAVADERLSDKSDAAAQFCRCSDPVIMHVHALRYGKNDGQQFPAKSHTAAHITVF